MTSARFWLLAGAALAPICLAQPAVAAVHRFHQDHVLGTSMDLVVAGADARQAARALVAARAEVRRLDRVLSGWRPDSELARLNASSGPVIVSVDLFRVIDRCEQLRRDCAGAFSARMGKVQTLWRDAARSGADVDTRLAARAAQAAEQAQVVLDRRARSIDRDGVVFAVDALAKGYIVDAALEAAARAAPGASGLMLDIGGDLRCAGSAPDPSGWRVGLARGADADNVAPAQVIRVMDRAVATSGPGARDLRICGRSLSHTLDPAHGRPVAHRTVTVVADSAAQADGLATALSVAPLAHGLALAERAGAHARVLEADGRLWTTAGWDNLLAPAILTTHQAPARLIRAAAPAPAAPWPAGFEVGIDYEIAYVPAGRYRPPFVAIWIADAQGRPVRTLYHLGTRPRRYLDSNYVWWAGFNADGSGVAKLDSVTRPSREPGRYSAVWDGKDDGGAPVGQGRYTINIEMTREHGGHSLQTIPLDLGRAAVSGSANGQGESGAASARYGRPAA
jgi:thiamine biosynthesis lipoprotein